MDVDDPEQNVEVEQPALALLMDDEVEGRPVSNGVDTAAVEDSEGLAAPNEKGLAKYSSSTHGRQRRIVPQKFDKTETPFTSCSFKVSSPKSII